MSLVWPGAGVAMLWLLAESPRQPGAGAGAADAHPRGVAWADVRADLRRRPGCRCPWRARPGSPSRCCGAGVRPSWVPAAPRASARPARWRYTCWRRPSAAWRAPRSAPCGVWLASGRPAGPPGCRRRGSAGTSPASRGPRVRRAPGVGVGTPRASLRGPRAAADASSPLMWVVSVLVVLASSSCQPLPIVFLVMPLARVVGGAVPHLPRRAPRAGPGSRRHRCSTLAGWTGRRPPHTTPLAGDAGRADLPRRRAPDRVWRSAR